IDESESEFSELDSETGPVLDRAAEFIGVTNPQASNVESSYSEVRSKITDTQKGLTEHDEKLSADLEDIEERVAELMTQLKDLNDNFHGDNGLKYDKIGEIENQDWYKDEQTGAFAQKIEDDPFFHLAGSASVSESQVVLGD